MNEKRRQVGEAPVVTGLSYAFLLDRNIGWFIIASNLLPIIDEMVPYIVHKKQHPNLCFVFFVTSIKAINICHIFVSLCVK